VFFYFTVTIAYAQAQVLSRAIAYENGNGGDDLSVSAFSAASR